MEAVYKYYKPAWRSFYAKLLLMLLLVVIGGVVNYFKAGEGWLKLMWIAIAAIDVVIFIYIAVQRGTMSLILRDNPDKAEDQEVAFVVCHPLKPFSSNFRESVEIGLSNIVHIKLGQTMMQSMLNIGDVIITSSGTGTEEIYARNIPNPQAVRDEIQVHARRYKMPPQSSQSPIFPTRNAPVTAVQP